MSKKKHPSVIVQSNAELLDQLMRSVDKISRQNELISQQNELTRILLKLTRKHITEARKRNKVRTFADSITAIINSDQKQESE